LQLKTGDDMIVYFIQQPPRIRKFKITGVYSTGLDEFDNLYAFCNIDIIRTLNNWDKTQAGGYEILIRDLNKLEQVNDEIYKSAGFEFYTQSIREQYPQLFHWLDLQNINVIIIIGLILLIAGISMISTLLILILENTAMIGMLKALGAGDRKYPKDFYLYRSTGNRHRNNCRKYFRHRPLLTAMEIRTGHTSPGIVLCEYRSG
jgi:lipoprotein-releasing system permease protein